MTATAAATPKKTKQTTEYVVLRESNEQQAGSGPPITHTVVKTVTAASANDAIRQAAGEKQGVYRAIPARSFKPVKVTVHTETTVRLG